MARALVVDIIDLRAERQRALASRTVLGACRNVLGYLLCAYCLFKCAPFACTMLCSSRLLAFTPDSPLSCCLSLSVQDAVPVSRVFASICPAAPCPIGSKPASALGCQVTQGAVWNSIGAEGARFWGEL